MRTIEDMGLESAHVKRSTNTHHFHEYFFSQFDCIWLYIRIPVNPDEFKWAIFPMQRSIFGPKSRTWRCSFAACAGESVWQILCALVLVVYHLVIKHGLELPHLYQMFHWFLEGSCSFCHQKKDSLTAVPHLGRTREIVMDSPDPGRSLWDADWHVERSVIDVVILFWSEKIEVWRSACHLFSFYMISDICWYLWKPCGVWSICENTRLFPALFRVSRSVYRNPLSKSINKWVWTVWTLKFYL